MSQTVYLLTICIPLGTLLAIFGMKYFAAIQQARARLAHDDAYRDLAAQAARAQSDTAATLAALRAELADVSGRMGAVEKMLREVE